MAERLVRFGGPWLQPQPNDRFLVSPFVRPLGLSELPLPEQQRVLRALAEGIMLRPRKTVVDVGFAAEYLAGADEWE